MKIILADTFNNCVISTHRTVAAAVEARAAHSRMIIRKNGRGSYIPYSITSKNGDDISEDIFRAESFRCIQ